MRATHFLERGGRSKRPPLCDHPGVARICVERDVDHSSYGFVEDSFRLRGRILSAIQSDYTRPPQEFKHAGIGSRPRTLFIWGFFFSNLWRSWGRPPAPGICRQLRFVPLPNRIARRVIAPQHFWTVPFANARGAEFAIVLTPRCPAFIAAASIPP